LKSFNDGFDVVALKRLNDPAERFPLCTPVAQGHDLLNGAVDLLAIAVDGSDEVVNLVMRSIHGSFPYLSFLLFTIAHQNKDQPVVAVELLPLCGADRNRKALAQ